MSVTTPLLTGNFVVDPVHPSFRFSVTHTKLATFSATFDDVDVLVVADAGGIGLDGSVRS